MALNWNTWNPTKHFHTKVNSNLWLPVLHSVKAQEAKCSSWLSGSKTQVQISRMFEAWYRANMFNLKIATVSNIITIHSILEVYSAKSGSFDIRSFLGKNVKGIRASGQGNKSQRFQFMFKQFTFLLFMFYKKKRFQFMFFWKHGCNYVFFKRWQLKKRLQVVFFFNKKILNTDKLQSTWQCTTEKCNSR